MSDKTKVIIMLGVLVALDLCIIGGILLHGKANFIELYKHLKHLK
jgi:hypothetical protein